MSIVLVGSTSGSVTLQEPAVAGSTVLTLPAVSGTILTTTSPKAGNVIQVVNATYSTSTTNSTTTYADTGLTATITPTSSSSKILILISHVGLSKGSANGDSAINIRLLRASTSIATLATQLGYQNSAVRLDFSGFFSYLDSPATTSSTTYKTQFANANTSAAVTVQSSSDTAIMTLLEIAA